MIAAFKPLVIRGGPYLHNPMPQFNMIAACQVAGKAVRGLIKALKSAMVFQYIIWYISGTKKLPNEKK